MTNASVSNDERHLPLNGSVVIQGLVFTWACESCAVLKVQHPQYGMRVVSLGRHYEPAILANLTALGMLAPRTTLTWIVPLAAETQFTGELSE